MRATGARSVLPGLLFLIAASAASLGAGDNPETLILGLSSFWRCHYTLKPPVVRKGPDLENVNFDTRYVHNSKWLAFDTPLPPAGWPSPDFDDGGWQRMPAVNPDSPWVALLCLRGKFTVADPTKAAGLTLSASYRGGIVVYLNGREIARGHLPVTGGPDELAEDYPQDAFEKAERLDRTLENVAVPAGLVRRGTNVLALEIHRSAYPEAAVKQVDRQSNLDFGTCGPVRVRLTAADADAVTANFARPKGIQVWNSDPMASDFDVDQGDPNETLRPIRLVAPQNGACSGKVVVGRDVPIQGLTAVISDFTQAAGNVRIPASAVQVRYALPTTHEAEANWVYTVNPGRFDALEDAPPAEVPVRKSRQSWQGRTLPDEPPIVFGAVQPVWVTVRVPPDATPGSYAARITIRIPDEKDISVPVSLEVCPWDLPEPVRFQTFVEIVQSPESLAMEYDVPIYSDRHFELIAKSLKLLGQVGNKTCHVPLISDTNQGNDQSMVRWVRQADGTYRHDFSVMERYLDLVEKHQGRPAVVCFYVWDTYLEGGRGGAEQWASDATKEDRKAHEGQGPVVSLLDPGTGKVEKLALPQYRDERSRALWQPLFDEVRKRMQRRGLEKAMMIGILTDNVPTEEVVGFFKTVCPGVPWVNHAHPYRTEIYKVPVGYSSGIWSGGRFAADPSVSRRYGWKRTDMGVHFPRSLFDSFPQTTWRFMGEMNITGEQQGFARLGGDFFAVLRDSRGQRRGTLSARFPKTSWRNLNIGTCLLAPGKEGPVPTARFEMLREGLQECEARIFIEKALTDPDASGLRAKLGEALAGRCQTLLDDRVRDMRRAVSTLRASGPWTLHAYIDNTWWQAPGVVGSWWFVASDWQTETQKLYAAAAEVDRVLHNR